MAAYPHDNVSIAFDYDKLRIVIKVSANCDIKWCRQHSLRAHFDSYGSDGIVGDVLWIAEHAGISAEEAFDIYLTHMPFSIAIDTIMKVMSQLKTSSNRSQSSSQT